MIELGILIELREEHPSKKPNSKQKADSVGQSINTGIDVMFSDKLIDFNNEQPQNTPPPIVITLLGIVIEVRESQ